MSTMTEHRRRQAYSHPASQRTRDDREPRPQTPLGALRARHAQEKAELGSRHHQQATDAAQRSRHVDEKISRDEISKMNVRHNNERARLASRHEQELKQQLDRDEQERRAARR